ncbi:MAG: rhomboid family intramembrane serine protease [Acidobacteriia bacterium]|nr:rhomboid family intramembrane serine protease [Terriglobia bacterium]
MANCIRCGRQLPPLAFKKICQWCVQHEAAQRGEESDSARQPVITRPWVSRSESSITLTQVIFGANIAVFLATALASGSAINISGEVNFHYGANFGPYTLSGEWWRLLTYMFLHGGAMHIFFNMWCLWDLGRLCESLYGRWTFATIYLITGVAGGLASIAWNPRVLSVGASGAIFGLAGALIASFYLGEFSLPRVAISGTLRSLVIFAVFNLGFGQILGTVDNACHIGGLVSGLILGALIARLAPQPDVPLRRATVVGVVALALLTAGFGVRQWRGGPMRMARAFQETKGDPVARLQAVIKQQPNLAPAHFALAQTYLARQQFAEAEAEFKRVIQLEPGNLDARFDLGLVYMTEKRPEDAKSAFTQILAQDPNSAEGHYGLGLVLADQQNHSAAIEEFKKAAPDTHLSGVSFEMGNSYAKLNRYDDAINAYLKEKEKSGDSADIENALADAYQAKGALKEAQDARDLAQQLRGPATH